MARIESNFLWYHFFLLDEKEFVKMMLNCYYEHVKLSRNSTKGTFKVGQCELHQYKDFRIEIDTQQNHLIPPRFFLFGSFELVNMSWLPLSKPSEILVNCEWCTIVQQCNDSTSKKGQCFFQKTSTYSGINPCRIYYGNFLVIPTFYLRKYSTTFASLLLRIVKLQENVLYSHSCMLMSSQNFTLVPFQSQGHWVRLWWQISLSTFIIQLSSFLTQCLSHSFILLSISVIPFFSLKKWNFAYKREIYEEGSFKIEAVRRVRKYTAERKIGSKETKTILCTAIEKTRIVSLRGERRLVSCQI